MHSLIRLIAPFWLAFTAPAWAGSLPWPFSAPPPAPAKPATGFPLSALPSTPVTAPYGAAPFGQAYVNPFSMFSSAPPPMGGFGGVSMSNMLSPMMGGAMSFAMPFVGNYAIASINPTTFSNFIGLMMRPQSSPFGSPFGGGFPGFGTIPAQPSSPFPFIPGFRR